MQYVIDSAGTTLFAWIMPLTALLIVAVTSLFTGMQSLGVWLKNQAVFCMICWLLVNGLAAFILVGSATDQELTKLTRAFRDLPNLCEPLIESSDRAVTIAKRLGRLPRHTLMDVKRDIDDCAEGVSLDRTLAILKRQDAGAASNADEISRRVQGIGDQLASIRR